MSALPPKADIGQLRGAADCDAIICYGGAKLADKPLASKVHCVDDEIIGWLERREQRRRGRQGVARVPELTAIADIKLNERHSLRRCKDRIRLITPDISPGCRREAVGRTFSARRLV
jgi:hypothetical protein